jgi:hypothetical protein
VGFPSSADLIPSLQFLLKERGSLEALEAQAMLESRLVLRCWRAVLENLRHRYEASHVRRHLCAPNVEDTRNETPRETGSMCAALRAAMDFRGGERRLRCLQPRV